MIKKESQHIIKRIIDIVISTIMLIIAFPFLVLIGILIKIDTKGPAFFKQKRVGKGEKVFTTYKFRTMVENVKRINSKNKLEKNDPHITIIGKYLRWGIDELPQLFNVLKGDMSLVGPRPTVPNHVKRYSKWEKRRLEVKPGITGWVIINGRNLLSWPERIKLDIWYIDHWSLWLDFRILIKTIVVIFFTRKGIYGKDGVNWGYLASKENENDVK